MLQSENVIVEGTMEEEHPAWHFPYTTEETEVGRHHEMVTKAGNSTWPPGSCPSSQPYATHIISHMTSLCFDVLFCEIKSTLFSLPMLLCFINIK